MLTETASGAGDVVWANAGDESKLIQSKTRLAERVEALHCFARRGIGQPFDKLR